MPIEVNPKTRESRLVKSVPRYIMRSASTIVRSFALYKPFRFFFAIGAVPFFVGVAARSSGGCCCTRSRTDYTSRVPSLLAGIGLLILAVQVWSVAFLADLQSSNRRMLAELRLRSKRLEYGDDSVADRPDRQRSHSPSLRFGSGPLERRRILQDSDRRGGRR